MSFLKRIFNSISSWLSTSSQQQIGHVNRIPTNTRNNVWTKYNGQKDRGYCYACGCIINRYNAGWHCSHVIAHSKGGSNSVDNLRPCCRTCNLSMGDQNLYSYIKEKRLKGEGSNNTFGYFIRHPMQIGDKRTNNWKKK